jgi:hypothetical protein
LRLGRRLHDENALGFAVRQIVGAQHKLKGVEVVRRGDRHPDGLRAVFRVDDLFANLALEDRVDGLHELVEGRVGRERHKLIFGNVAAHLALGRTILRRGRRDDRNSGRHEPEPEKQAKRVHREAGHESKRGVRHGHPQTRATRYGDE